MDAHPEIQANDPALARIVSMLIALAVLAERASARSLPVRSLVLWVLRMAEAVVWEMIDDAAQASHELGAPFFRHGDSRADCIRLAMRFRALAQALGDLPCETHSAPPLLLELVRRVGAILAARDSSVRTCPAPAARYPDTS